MGTELQLYIEGNRVDLFRDESVSIVQTIQNVKDLSQIFVEFTRTFTVPASRKNNKIFKHYYNYSIIDGFDGRLKKSATIELNSRPFKTGKIKLEGVDLKDNSPEQYRITFFGNTIDINDVMGDDGLSSLDLTDFNSTYDATTVKSALESGLNKTYTRSDDSTISYPEGIIAPLISHTTRLYYENAVTEVYPDALGGNLYPKSTNHQGVYFEELKYGIRVDAIIRAIEDKYDLTFSDDFLKTENSPYYGLFLWLHRKKGKAFESSKVEKQITGFTNNYFVAIPEVGSFENRLVISGASTSIQSSLTVEAAVSFEGTLKIKKDGEPFDEVAVNGTSITRTNTLTNGTYTVFLESTASSITITTNTKWSLQQNFSPYTSAQYALTGSFAFDNTRQYIISEQIPEMKVIDFLTGLFNLFNLTAYTSGSTIVIKTLDDYYNSSDVVWDIGDSIDIEKSSVDVALPYKEVEFRFMGLETKLAKQHNQIANQSWSTEEYRGDDYYDANPETYTIELPFEHMKYERMYDGSSTTKAQVGWFVDDNSDPYFGEPLLFYAQKQTSATTIRFLNTENAGSYSDITNYYIPINSVDIDPTESDFNFNFRNELSEYTNSNEFIETLFKKYYQTYISKIFTTSKRLTQVFAYLPLKMIQELNLADLIAIGDKNYNINEIETDFTTGKSRIQLINQVTSSLGGSTPIEPPTTDPSVCTECSADSTFCTVDGTTPTADKTCDLGRSLVISGDTTAQTTNDITLLATPNNFIGTATYLWAGGTAAGLTADEITFTEAVGSEGNITYTCTADDDHDGDDFSDTHIVLWTPKTYRITLNIVDNINGDVAGYNISGDQTGDYLDLQEGETYAFNSAVNPNSGYEFTTGPTVQNAQGTVATSSITVNTTLSGAVQLTQDYVTIYGPANQTVSNNAQLIAYTTGFTATGLQWARSTDGGNTYVNESGETSANYDANESSADIYWYRITATATGISAQDVHEVLFTDQALVTLTLAVDTSNIIASGFATVTDGFTLSGDLAGTTKTQNSGTVFNFQTTIELNSGFEWTGTPSTASNAGGTYTSDQTVTTTFSVATIQLIVYNYYIVTGCTGTIVAGETIYIRSRETFTVGSTTTGTYITIDGQCYYTSSTTFASTWATNNGVTVGEGEGTGCADCTDTGTTVDPCLATKSIFYLRYSSVNTVCENHQEKNYYYVNGASVTQTQGNWCDRTNLYTYNDCSVAAPTGYYSLDLDNTERRYWNGTAFSVCVTCIDARYLYFLGIGWNPQHQYCDDSQRVGGYYYFDNNAGLITANSLEHMYTSATDLGTTNRAPEGFYTDGTFYRYYEPQSLQVWENYGDCPTRPTTTSTTTVPTLTVFRQYGDCPTGGLDALKIFGNDSTAGFPYVIEDEHGDCWSNPAYTATTSSDWIGNFDHFSTCADCTGGTTTTTTSTTSRPDNVFVVVRQSDAYGTYVQLDAEYQVGNENITISTDGANCYDITGKAAVLDETIYGLITGICTTTTTTTTTTTATCGTQNLYKSTVSVADVCCNVTVTKVTYMDSNDISTATKLYIEDSCTTYVASTTYFTADFSNYYTWNHITNTLSGPTSCPSC